MQLLRELEGFDDDATLEAEEESEHSLAGWGPPAEREGEGGEFGITDLPSAVGVALRSGAERVAVRLAIRAGHRDENKLTNLLFFTRHPGRFGQKLLKSDPEFQQLSTEWLSIRNNIVRPALRETAGGSTVPAAPSGGPLPYPVTPGEEYGGRWKTQRPPGLPTTARQTSSRGAAVSHIEAASRAQGLDETFLRVVRHLALTESGARFALPANTFDARPAHERPAGKSLITAWGAFQFNRDAWRALPGVAKAAFPWDAMPREEIERPVARYAALYREVRSAGGTAFDAARGIRLWHRSPAAYRGYVRAGRGAGFSAAWAAVAASHRTSVDEHLQKIGLRQAALQELEDSFIWEVPEPTAELSASGIEDRTHLSPRDKRKGTRDPSMVTALVLHQMAFSRGSNPAKYDRVTAHFVILPNGHTAQLHPASAILWASNGFNKRSVAVEFAGNFPSIRGRCWKPEKFGCHRVTPEQIAAGRNLIRHLVSTLGIRHVLAHRQSSASRENDPGPDLWYHVGQWAKDNLGLSDGGPGFKVEDGKPIPPEWRAARSGTSSGELGELPGVEHFDRLVIDSRIDVDAQRALISMAHSANPAQNTAALDVLFLVRNERLLGIHKPDQQVPALIARQYGMGWWQLLAPGETFTLICDPRQPRSGPDLVFRKGLTKPELIAVLMQVAAVEAQLRNPTACTSV